MIVRTVGPYAPATAWGVETSARTPGQGYEDLKLFATGWIGGLVFFGTLLA